MRALVNIGRMSVLLVLLAGGLFSTFGATYYVAQNNPNPAPPYATWNTAATNIQDAINVAGNGDLVLVTNGTYAYGGLAMSGTLTNRVALTLPLTVQSVNGPWVTTILGAGITNGPNAVRCAWLTNGAALVGFTLTAGATALGGGINSYGGGVWCASTNALVANSVIVSNNAFAYGGGAYGGDLQNCWIANNNCTLSGGGGAAYANLSSCTVVYSGGSGVYNANCTNCIIYYSANADHQGVGNLVYCCTTLPPGGAGNISAAPQLFADGVHLLAGSPCIGAGINHVSGTDIFGHPWNNPPSMGCAEWTPAPVVATPQVQFTGNPGGFAFENVPVTGQTPLYFSWLQNGVPLTDNGHFSGSQTTNLAASGVIPSDAASYQLVVSNALGVVTSSVANVVIHFVVAGAANPVPPYTSWATAAANIQSAISAAAAGEVVLVTNGFYGTGGISMDGKLTNCVSVNQAILVQSVNGPNNTIIQGAWDATSTNGPGAMRCAWLTNSAVLAGFTLQGGATFSSGTVTDEEGGGIYGASTNALAYNCVISGNSAVNGGGVCKAALFHCTVSGNRASSEGGGAYQGNLVNSVIKGNTCGIANQGGVYGGGTEGCHATNCVFLLNYSLGPGAAADGGTLVNCTVTENLASSSSAAVTSATLVNSIVYGNGALNSNSTFNYASCTLTYCDTDPLPAGTGNLDVNPQLLADNIHLAATSPVIGKGNAAVVTGTDIDGQPWNNPPSLGCDEWQPAPAVNPPLVQVTAPAYGVTLNAVAAGQGPFTFTWNLNGTALQDNGHYTNSGTASLIINQVSLADAGSFQVVVSNAVGVVTSSVVPLVIHAVNAAGNNPVPPYTSWATAATNIQDAVNAAAAGDIVLVTNGLYSFGGALADGLTNRVAVSLPISVIGLNGSAVTTIQGAWDPATTNGPNAVRGVVLPDGAALTGFTVCNGATLGKATPGNTGNPYQSGGGILCNSTNGIVSNCVLSNNAAMYGGGISSGTLNNSFLIANQAANYQGGGNGSGGLGGGAYGTTLNNCTVTENYIANMTGFTFYSAVYGAGVYNGQVANSIVIYNVDFNNFGPAFSDNCYPANPATSYFNTDTSPAPTGNGNTNVPPGLVDNYHLGLTSPCRGAGSAAFAIGVDLDGQPWANPPSIGCSEVVPASLGGPLAVTLTGWPTNLYTGRPGEVTATITGRATSTTLSFGDGQVVTNSGLALAHVWTQSGSMPITFTAYNNDNPAGVSASAVATLLPLIASPLQSVGWSSSGFTLQFLSVPTGLYVLQYTTNLTPPVIWKNLTGFTPGFISGTTQFTDPGAATNVMRFYRVQAE